MFSNDTLNGCNISIPGVQQARLIKKFWEVSWDMWDHQNKGRVHTFTRADLQEVKLLNAQITEQFSEGTTRGLGAKDY